MTGRAVAAAYVATVTGLAALGFAGDSTAVILLAAALTLPSGVPAVVGYYVAYGLLALAPGANPSVSTGTSCNSIGCVSSLTGGPAPWFAVTTDLLGVVALAGAALVQVLLVRLVLRGRRKGGPA
ncbi:MAG TPA: hypothetical protein VFT70_09460 [Nocardioides sp.]|nr:hypothetical protein [Nocardioides sp.]